MTSSAVTRRQPTGVTLGTNYMAREPSSARETEPGVTPGLSVSEVSAKFTCRMK